MRQRDQAGAISAETALCFPLLLGGLAVVWMAGTFVSARDDVSNAAFAAARAASYTSNPAAAQSAGIAAATAALASHGRECASMTTLVDTSDFVAGGDIKVTVTCVANLATVNGVVFIPVHKSFTTTAVVPIDSHRVLP